MFFYRVLKHKHSSVYVDLHLCQDQLNLLLEETSRSFISQQYCFFNCVCALWVLTLAVLYYYYQLITTTKTQYPMTSISVFPISWVSPCPRTHRDTAAVYDEMPDEC